ncbi:hypothetical protein [Microlunatus parietis]|uniref:Protein ImuA n=1 Tax=Microlunatus parietis TaxID=682979 RepID=A0A7Y9IDZ5_9ACTN|nr:hypothetical protein [Microlunatus parietis]NYE75191.1 hypothetical protein [Microlunatus parietis]
MSVARLPDSARIRELQDRVLRMQGSGISRALPVIAPLEPLLVPRTGGTYVVDSPSLAMLLMAAPSQAGEWVAVVGAADFGLAAAAGFGVDLTRTIAVPEPGERWPDVVAGLAEIVSVIMVRPPRVTEHQAARLRTRLRTRLRQRDAMLISWGDWPRSEARLGIESSAWDGLGRGHGRITGRRTVVTVRRAGRPASRIELWLPGPDLRVDTVPEIAEERIAEAV